MKNIDSTLFSERICKYLQELESGNVAGVLALFTPDARIHSPLLGWVTPAPFYSKLAEASGDSKIKLLDICSSIQGNARAVAYFTYDWQLKDGSRVSFDCVDVFDFNEEGLIDNMVIVYDTHSIRGDLGDRFR
ncbi:MAG TPA: nuclear transport factor 2 family protein [Burkholderiaceae bacterium]